MEKQDPRTLTPAAQEQNRRQAIRLYNQGYKQKDIAVMVGVSQNSISKWCRAYNKSGIAGIKSKQRGVKIGQNRTLTPEQEAEIQKCILDKSPDQYKMTFALWNRQAVGELIKHRTGITMPIRTVGEYLHRWGFTPQKPLKRAYEQNPKAVQKWLDEEYPTIHQQAAQEDAEIHWGDETGIRSDGQHGRSYSPKGITPVIRLSAKRSSVNMISTVTNQGKVRFMIYEETMNAKMLIKFMKRLCKDSGKKVYLILDNLRVHHAKVVKEWLEKNTEKILVYYLPSYSPELNPDEYLNNDLKCGVHSKPPMRSQRDLNKAVESHMRTIQNHPQRAANYFKHPKIRYAA
jgi:transposase